MLKLLFLLFVGLELVTIVIYLCLQKLVNQKYPSLRQPVQTTPLRSGAHNTTWSIASVTIRKPRINKPKQSGAGCCSCLRVWAVVPRVFGVRFRQLASIYFSYRFIGERLRFSARPTPQFNTTTASMAGAHWTWSRSCGKLWGNWRKIASAEIADHQADEFTLDMVVGGDFLVIAIVCAISIKFWV